MDKTAEQVYDKEKLMKRILFVVVLAAMIVGTTGSASAAPTTRTYFTGTAACDPLSVTVVREWMAGPNYQGRGFAQTCYDTASIPELNGIEYINFHVVGRNGILSGKDRMETNEGGVWVGSWVWPANTWILRIVMQGEGKYAGQQLRMFENAEDGSFWGYIEATGE
jgi:hypothetical protein